jgi:chorismate mutase
VTAPDERIAELRGRITANDRTIVEAVNRRLRLVAELWELKDAQSADRFDPERERRLREELRAANDGPLSPAGLDLLVTQLLELTKRELGEGG